MRGGNTRKKRGKQNNIPPKLQCNTISRKNKISKNSCFTNEALLLLKDSYNAKNPSMKINSTDGKNILREIQTKSDQVCREDLCLIEKFAHNKRDTDMLKTLLFPPPKPSEWYSDPDAWLSNFDIMKVLNQYQVSYPHFAFIGPSPIDYDTKLNKHSCVCKNLCKFQVKNYLKKNITKIGIVFNLDPHTKGGSHWVAMFVDLKDDFVFFFNSTGEKIPKRIRQFATTVIQQGKELIPPKNITFHENTKMEHQKSDTECGMYCLYFIITMLIRKTEIGDDEEEDQPEMNKQQLFDLFQGTSKSGRLPDKKMFEKRDEYFSHFKTSSSG